MKKEVPFALRARAAGALLGVDGQLAATRSAEILHAATPGQAPDTGDVFDAFLTRKNGPQSLAKALQGKRLASEVAVLGVQRASSSAGDTKALIEALTKAGQLEPITRALGKAEMAEMMAEVAESGNAARGEVIYERSQLACATCHAIGGAGGAIGPDLVSLGASAPVDYIIESLLEPNKKIKEGYHTTQITKKNGDVLSGGLVRDGGGVVVVRDPTGKQIKVPSDQIASRSVSPVSLMPPGLVASLRRDQLVDLVRFLSELGKEGDYKVPRQRYVRRWRAAADREAVGHLLRRSGVNPNMLSSDQIRWLPVYSRVDGGLPLERLTAARGFQGEISLARFELDVDVAGEIKLQVNDATGLQVWAGEGTLEFAERVASINVSAGRQTFTVVVDRNARVAPLRIEVLDGSGRGAPVGGL